MQDRIKVNAREVVDLAKKAFPNYEGRKFFLSTRIPQVLDSYWDGGSRDYYTFVEIATGKRLEVGSNHPMFEKEKPRNLGGQLPDGVALVRRSIFMGKETGLEVMVNPKELNPKWIEAGVER